MSALSPKMTSSLARDVYALSDLPTLKAATIVLKKRYKDDFSFA